MTTYKFQCAMLLKFESQIPRRYAPGIIRSKIFRALRFGKSRLITTYKFQCAMLLKFGSQIPRRYAPGIIRSKIFRALRFGKSRLIKKGLPQGKTFIRHFSSIPSQSIREIQAVRTYLTPTQSLVKHFFIKNLVFTDALGYIT